MRDFWDGPNVMQILTIKRHSQFDEMPRLPIEQAKLEKESVFYY